MNYQMTLKDGLTVSQEILQLNSNPPVIFISANKTAQIEATNLDYIRPVDLDHLLQNINKALLYKSFDSLEPS
ncbi:MAG: hypothetical protein ACFFBD_14600 [Candidatus Hodarchaeota archaeon]